MRCIKGEKKGIEFDLIPSHLIHWKNWRKMFPDTHVLSHPKVFTLEEYLTDSYAEYRNSTSSGVFPLDNQNFNYEAKEVILGVKIKESIKAYMFTELETKSVIMDTIEEASIVITFAYGSAQAFFAGSNVFEPYNETMMKDEDGNLWNMITGISKSGIGLTSLKSITVYWFAWYDFYPETEVYSKK
jgi:hypothetical protein